MRRTSSRSALIALSVTLLAASGAGAAPKKVRRALRPAPVRTAPATNAPEAALSAVELIKRSDWQMRGRSLESRVMMRVVRGKETRTLEFLLWAKGTERAVVKILSPEKDRSTAHLRIGTDLWNYLPSVEHVQKVAPSMMKTAWMGADFSNGDLVRSTNLSRYYDHRLLGRERIEGFDAYKVESSPRKDAPVEPGKIFSWVTADGLQVKQEYFGEDGKLQRTLIGKNFKQSGEHHYPSTLVVTKAGEKNAFTQVDYRAVRFDQPLDETIFTQEFLKKRIDVPDLPRP